MSEQTKQKLAKARAWCAKESQDYIENLIRDLKSMRSIWCYAILAFTLWAFWWALTRYPKELGTAVIYSTATLAGAVFTNYVFASNSEKKMANQFPSYSAQPVPKVGDKMGPEQDNG